MHLWRTESSALKPPHTSPSILPGFLYQSLSSTSMSSRSLCTTFSISSLDHTWGKVEVTDQKGFHHRFIWVGRGLNTLPWLKREMEMVAEKVGKRRFEWLGHVARMPDHRLPKSRCSTSWCASWEGSKVIALFHQPSMLHLGDAHCQAKVTTGLLVY